MNNTIENALERLRKGQFIIVVDHPERENEGDLIIAAEKITDEAIAFMAKKASGLICLTITQGKANQLNLPLQEHGRYQSHLRTAFTYSIGSRFGITTGISAADRAHTILTVLKDNASSEDIIIPGHIFPLIAKSGGILERTGHTEASVDLMRLAGLKPAGVICEIMGENGKMLRGKTLADFAQKYDIPIISIEELIDYRKKHDNAVINENKSSIHIAASSPLQTQYGSFIMMTFFVQKDPREHIALIHGDVNKPIRASVRIHSECLTGDVFGSLQCDCGHQLQKSLSSLAQTELGILIYLRQEGRDIGLTNKLRAYHLQSQGYDTVEANVALGLPVDNRHFKPVVDFLHYFNIHAVNLLTNNPHKISALESANITVSRQPLMIKKNKFNAHYLETKKNKLHHLMT